MQVTTSAIINGEFADQYGNQAVACIHASCVRGYATHPTTAGNANLKIKV